MKAPEHAASEGEGNENLNKKKNRVRRGRSSREDSAKPNVQRKTDGLYPVGGGLGFWCGGCVLRIGDWMRRKTQGSTSNVLQLGDPV